jgi:hypothetical protein
MQKTVDDSYEILELNVSQPILFRGDNRKNQQHRYNEKNQIILVVPKENY